ncbi:MAG: hypothetical protein GX202_00130 [Firmicutes bacterium]|nr:hypothetical protein [Bacillota bacterium]
MGQIKAVLFDYGGMLSMKQVPEEIEAMLGLLQVACSLMIRKQTLMLPKSWGFLFTITGSRGSGLLKQSI